MMVTFVSQCEKNALKKTRRVLDAFADRIGDNTWQTVITEEGLQAVKKLLRKTNAPHLEGPDATVLLAKSKYLR